MAADHVIQGIAAFHQAVEQASITAQQGKLVTFGNTEHWISVSGTAKVTINDNTVLLSDNQSAYIPIGAVHALETPRKLLLGMIEVQLGSNLGEDDIVRFEDRYGSA